MWLCWPSYASAAWDSWPSRLNPLWREVYQQGLSHSSQPNHSAAARKKESLKSIWEGRGLGVWECETIRRREYLRGVGQVGTSPRNPAPGLSDKVSYSLLAVAFPLETKAHVLHLIAGARLLINLSEQLCPSADGLSASCLLGLSTFRIVLLPDSRKRSRGGRGVGVVSLSLFFPGRSRILKPATKVTQ